MHRDDEFSLRQGKVRLAVFDIELAQGNAANALRAGDVDFGAKSEKGGRKVAREGGVTVLSLRCLLYTSPSPRDRTRSRMPSSA